MCARAGKTAAAGDNPRGAPHSPYLKCGLRRFWFGWLQFIKDWVLCPKCTNPELNMTLKKKKFPEVRFGLHGQHA